MHSHVSGVFAFALAKKRGLSFFGVDIRLPTQERITQRLVVGSLLFGAGWGLAGFCPGPAMVSMADGQLKAMMFVVAMLVGMLGFELMDRFIHAPRKAKFNPV